MECDESNNDVPNLQYEWIDSLDKPFIAILSMIDLPFFELFKLSNAFSKTGNK
jgi:hypothetical protein